MTYRISDKQRSELSKIKPNWLTSLGIFFALGWLFITFLQEDPLLYLILGGLNLITMVLSRFIIRKRQGLELEGAITGYLITWLIASFFYQQKESLISLPFFESTFHVNEVMVVYLALSFLAWFVITPQKSTQDILWKLSPFYSNLLLNIWKLAVILLFLVNFVSKLNSFSDLATFFFLIVGFFELIIFYTRQVKLNYIDLILNPLQLLFTIISGPLEALKWIILTLIFIILGQFELEFGTLALIFAALFVAIISLTTNITRLFLNSGIIESRIEEGKVIIPRIIDEVQQMSSSDRLLKFDDFYEVPDQITIMKRNQIVTLSKGDIILRFPFSQELENQTGVFIFHLNMQKLTKQVKKRYIKKNRPFIKITTNSDEFKKGLNEAVKNLDLRGSSVHRISIDDWNNIVKSLKIIEKDAFAKKLGFDDSDTLDRELVKLIRGTVIAQEHIRSRLRGVPAPVFGKQRSYTSVIKSNGMDLPLDLIKEQKISDGQEIEIIPGKNEYIFYVKRKRTEDKNS